MATIKVSVVSAEEKIFEGDAELVSLPGVSGELGILRGHEPLITLIRPGTVRIHKAKDEIDEIFVAGGVLEVQPTVVTVLADTAIRTKDLDEARTVEALEAAKSQREQVKGDLEIAKVEAEISALSAQLALIKKIRQHR